MSNENTPKTPVPARTVIREVREGNTRSEEPTTPPQGRPDLVNKHRSDIPTRTNIQEGNTGGNRGGSGGGSQKTKR